MAKYKGRAPSENVTDIRTGRGSPDDRDIQNHSKQMHEDRAIVDYISAIGDALYGPPKPRPDPRTKMPGGELAIGEGQTRQEFWTDLKEDVWVKQVAQELVTKHYRDKLLWVFPFSPKEKLDWAPALYDGENTNNAQFLLDTFKQMRSVGYQSYTMKDQPEPLPQKFKVSK